MTTLICPRCRHANPQHAQYCHHDGILLDGVREAQKAKSDFPSPFIFKSGLTCKDYKTLAQGILAEWDRSREMLAFAEWEDFFNGLGRVDLAQAASQARLFPDPDRGLDQLLSALPGLEARPGTVRIEKRALEFGTLQVGVEARSSIILENSGDRLIWGDAILRDAPWCSLSEEGPLADRSFRYIKQLKMDLHVPADNVRGGGRLLSGTLLIKTESEEILINISAKEPDVIPFDGDLFHGAISPRQIAEKSRTKPREAVPLFLSGKVAQWYQINGWSYPVTGPTAPGMACVQQYFEAHGFAPAPKVDIDPPAILLSVTPGEPATQKLLLKTSEKRHVFGYVLPSETWVHAGDLEPNYQTATIPLVFNTQGLNLHEPRRVVLTVLANGQQQFNIPVEIRASVPTPSLLDLDSLSGTSDQGDSIEFEPVELVESEPLDGDAHLTEATFINTQKSFIINTHSPGSSAAFTSDDIRPTTIPPPSSFSSVTDFKKDDLFIPKTSSNLNMSSPPSPAMGEKILSDDKLVDEITQKNQSSSLIGKSRRRIFLLGATVPATVILLLLGTLALWRGNNQTVPKELVRPMIAGKPGFDLLSFTVETQDQDHVSLLATEANDTGSHFMLKSGNATASVNSKKSSSKTVSKWVAKDGWSHREVEMTVGGIKWRVGQWLRTLTETPHQCAVLFELSPVERDSKIAARLALRPGTGTGNSVRLYLPESSIPLKKNVLLRSEKIPDRLFFGIENPSISGVIGFESPEVLLPGMEKPISPARPTQLLVGHGTDTFGAWDCQFPELFDESSDAQSVGPQIGIVKGATTNSILKDPFVSLFWDDATVRKGQKRLIGFTLGIANQDVTK